MLQIQPEDTELCILLSHQNSQLPTGGTCVAVSTAQAASIYVPHQPLITLCSWTLSENKTLTRAFHSTPWPNIISGDCDNHMENPLKHQSLPPYNEISPVLESASLFSDHYLLRKSASSKQKSQGRSQVSSS